MLKLPSTEEMKSHGASDREIACLTELIGVLNPGLKTTMRGTRVQTSRGSKAALGLFRTIKDILEDYYD